MNTLRTVAPERAAELVRAGAVLVDIREADEHAREHIPGARHRALSGFDTETVGGPSDQMLIFYCRSGMRTRANAQRLAAAGSCEAYALEGGIDGWKKAGLPVTFDRRKPIELMRQVQITAGSLVLLGLILALISPAFILLSGFVGAGLVVAGATGFCGMARLLSAMPWNSNVAPAPIMQRDR
jgi:rhodanese-related sulfurtransferase